MSATAEVVNIHELAERFGIPARWIKTQCKAGTLPHLKIGHRRFFNPAAVSEALAKLASNYPEKGPDRA